MGFHEQLENEWLDCLVTNLRSGKSEENYQFV